VNVHHHGASAAAAILNRGKSASSPQAGTQGESAAFKKLKASLGGQKFSAGSPLAGGQKSAVSPQAGRLAKADRVRLDEDLVGPHGRAPPHERRLSRGRDACDRRRHKSIGRMRSRAADRRSRLHDRGRPLRIHRGLPAAPRRMLRQRVSALSRIRNSPRLSRLTHAAARPTTARHDRRHPHVRRIDRAGPGRSGIALMPFIAAGYPDLATSLAILPALADAGAAAIEVGFPFSDPRGRWAGDSGGVHRGAA
jgi:hypothetical protein